VFHDRLSDLRILSIEPHKFSEIDKRKVLAMFAQRKMRKVNTMRKLRLTIDIFQQTSIPIDTYTSQ